MSFGTITGGTKKGPAESTPLFDENGYTDGLVFYDETTEMTLKIRCKSSMLDPVTGTDLTISSGLAITAIIMDWSIDWEQRGFKQLSVDIKKFANALA